MQCKSCLPHVHCSEHPFVHNPADVPSVINHASDKVASTACIVQEICCSDSCDLRDISDCDCRILICDWLG